MKDESEDAELIENLDLVQALDLLKEDGQFEVIKEMDLIVQQDVEEGNGNEKSHD